MHLQVNNQINTVEGFTVESFIVKIAGAWYTKQPLRFSGEMYLNLEGFESGAMQLRTKINVTGSFVPSSSDIQTETYEEMKSQFIAEQGWSAESIILVN